MARKPDRRDIQAHDKGEENHWLFGGDRRAAKALDNESKHGTRAALSAREAKAIIRGHGLDDGKGKKK
jgi:hypothetical protein